MRLRRRGMNLAGLAWSSRRAKPLGTLLNVLLLALGVGTIGFVRIVEDKSASGSTATLAASISSWARRAAASN